MECSWKAVLLLVLASVAVQFTAIRTFIANKPFHICRVAKRTGCASSPPSLLPGQQDQGDPGDQDPGEQDQGASGSRTPRGCGQGSAPAPAPRPKPNHILILATTRSGSSFAGQLLNQHSRVFYLFEPLYHVQTTLITNNNSLNRVRHPPDRRALLGSYRDLLRSLFDCDLHFLENYIRPAPERHETHRLFRRGASKALCSPPVCPAPAPRRPEPLEEGECARRCGALNLTLASRVCRQMSHIAIKTVRIPGISDLRTLVQDPRLNVKVLQLVRDPRGILASRIDTFPDSFRPWKVWRSSGRRPYNLDVSHLTTTCEDFLSSAGTGLSRPGWLKGKYMLVRYEDLAREPGRKTREIYSFMGMEVDGNVRRWILNNTRGPGGSGHHKYATVRDSAATAESWRFRLSYDMVALVQSLCNATMARLGYRMVRSPRELRDMSVSLAEERTFLPFL
ncbi:carbohydrate sulfotransferase 1 [Callorhinchus milii]|uniref:carbohydrate sulfotransferase 1 n=1 Tax=Callorhinchus milii TaxID=7868 RepID=UPI001C3F6D8C|nr:carbohydrate sulfotransferase 1 [Callorhinchus milii]